MAVMKKEGDGEHPKSHYLVTTSDNVTDWHLRVMGMDGKPDMNLMGAAWAALHGGYRGNKYEGPDKEEAMNKLTALYKRMGKMPPGMSKAIFYRTKDTIWFFGVFSNNFEDTQNEIITEKAHEDYVKWLAETGIKPPITVFHQPKFPEMLHAVHYMSLVYGKITPEEYSANLEVLYKPYAIAKTETAMVINGFTFVVGKVYEHKKALVEKLMDQSSQWGMSHGFIPIEVNDNIIEKYRSFEFTIAPSTFVVNKITPIGLIKEDNEMDETYKSLTEEQRQLLQELLSGGADGIEDATEKAKEILATAGLASKTIVDVQFNPEIIENITNAFKAASESIEALQKKVEELQTKVDSLQKTDDEKVAEQFVVPNLSAYFRTQSVETSTEDEKELAENLKKDIPEGIVEDKTTSNDPLAIAISQMLRG